MAEEERIPGYLFGALGASDGKTESALVVIKIGVHAYGGKILNPHVASREENQKMREELGLKGLKKFDWDKIDEAKFAIGDVSLPSIGVGREIERLLNTRRVPILALRSAASNYHSALVDGEDDPNFLLDFYHNYVDLDVIIESFMRRLKTSWYDHQNG